MDVIIMNSENRKLWREDELLLALNLYSKLQFGQLHSRNKKIIRLAEYMGRTPGSVAMKLCNFASIDPELPRKGLSGASNLDRVMWNRYFSDESLIMVSEELMLSVFGKHSIVEAVKDELDDYCGSDVERLVQFRTHQSFFKAAVISNFDEKCCITGISKHELLIACHIIPWDSDIKNRLNPRNGLCLNALHAAAFDNGLITLDENLKVLVSSQLPRNHAHALILDFEGTEISMPHKYMPSNEFLNYHRNKIFVA